jgi:hypothetical protein
MRMKSAERGYLFQTYPDSVGPAGKPSTENNYPEEMHDEPTEEEQRPKWIFGGSIERAVRQEGKCQLFPRSYIHPICSCCMESGSTSHWESLEQQSPTAFIITGVLILLSVIIPIGLRTLTAWSWVSGLVLVGLAIVSVSVGLLGLYPIVKDHTPRLALAGAGAALVAGIAAFGLIVLTGVVMGSEFVAAFTITEPKTAFLLLSLSMAGSFSLGFLLFGIATWRNTAPSRKVAGLLIAGGLALLIPVVIEFAGGVLGLTTPPWLLFPVIVAVALDSAAIGYSLRS